MNSLKLYIASKIIHILPETRAFKLKNRLYRWTGVKIGKNVRICSSAMIIGTGELEIGNNTWVGHRAFISASSSIKIGSNVDIAPNVFIGNGTHEITPDRDRIADIEISKDISIGDGCWLCANTTIIAGVYLEEKCIVAAGAVVTKSFKGMSVIGGVPARIIKKLD